MMRITECRHWAGLLSEEHMKGFYAAVGLAGMAALVGCGSDIAEGPVAYPAEDGSYFQVFDVDGTEVIEIARVRKGSVASTRGELPAGAGVSLTTGNLHVVFEGCGRYQLFGTHPSSNPAGMKSPVIHLIPKRHECKSKKKHAAMGGLTAVESEREFVQIGL
jgi:hypothetical protein